MELEENDRYCFTNSCFPIPYRLVFVIFLFLKLSQKFENFKLDISTTFKEKDQIAVLSSATEQDFISIKENIVSFTKQLQEYLNNSMSKIREDTKKTADLLENLNSIVNQKDKDLDRFKKGYDLVRLRSFVLNVVEAISFLQNRKSDLLMKILSYVNTYEKQLLRILDDLGIQSFVPKIGDITTDVEVSR